MAVVTTNLGVVTAYGDAVRGGYTGTKEQWEALMADYGTIGTQAQQDAQTASTAAQTATTKASEASASATQAQQAAASVSTPDTTLTQSGKAADAKATGDEISALKEDLNDKAPLKYITDIAVITPTTYTQITKDSENVTAETGKKLSASGAITSNGSYSYIAYEVTQNGLYYCTTGQSDSGTCVYSGLPLGASTLIKSASKSNFPTQANPWEVEAGQIVAVGSKTTAISQNIFLSGVGEASIPEIPVMQEDIKILEQGRCPITDIAAFQLGRYSQSDNSIHTSTTIACSKTAIQFDYNAVLIADLGYAMDIKLSSDGSTYTWNQHECAFFVPKNNYIKIAVYAIGSSVEVTDPTERGSHVKVINTNIPTSDYSRYHDSFFGIEMYNTVGFIGDSYTARRSTYNNSWTTILAQTKGFVPTLYAHSGYTTKAWIDSILPTLLADTPLDLYWLGLGINDASRILSSEAYTVGSEADLSGSYADYPDTFWGNYGKIIESIQAHAPNAHMVIATVIYHDMYTAQKNNGSTNIPPINEAIRGLAEHYNIPLIELADDIFYRSPEYQDNMQATAYTHPDPILFPGMANANARLFSKAVVDNPAYFKTSTSNT